LVLPDDIHNTQGDTKWGIVFVDNASGKEVEHARIGKLPPSAKLVFKVLEANGQMTQKDIIRETVLPSRTVRYALSRLKDEQILMERFNFSDSRQSLYEIRRHGSMAIVA
jgi:DNA-binding MarR family transcriptional regulator